MPVPYDGKCGQISRWEERMVCSRTFTQLALLITILGYKRCKKCSKLQVGRAGVQVVCPPLLKYKQCR